MEQLAGQVCLVTGGGSGIGQASAAALARAGAAVAVVGRRREPLAEVVAGLAAEGRAAVALPGDVTDPAVAEDVVADVLDRWGRLDVLVNSAGANVPDRDLESLSVADWHTVVQSNLTGTFLVTRAALPTMRRQRSGTVVNVSSIAGHRPMRLTGPAYNAAKAGVNAFTESINMADRRHGIRACAVCPGEVATPFLAFRPTPPSDAARATMLRAEDVAAAVLFVATLPPRVNVDLLTMQPTEQRDWSAELR
ncbi:SDR family oxidoreductase [Geodermatophilus sp. SYSU D00815]